MELVTLINKESHQVATQTLTGNVAKLLPNSPVVVKLDIAKEEISQVQRQGTDVEREY